jgi:hypothetical protein
MSDEPRQPIEKALEAYAGERRRRVGGPFAMPPHVRSRLHREIERLDGATAGATGARFSILHWLMRPWAWGVAAGLVLVAAVNWQWLGGNPPVKTMAQAEPPSPAPANAAPEMEALAPTAAVAELPSSARVSAPALAPSFEPAAKDEVRATAHLEMAVAPKTKTSLAQADAYGGVPAAVRSVTGRFAAQELVSRPRQAYRQSVPSPQAQETLQDFRIEQVGDALRVVDADGSVYPARLVAASSLSQASQRDVAATTLPAAQNQATSFGVPLLRGPAPRLQPAADAAVQNQAMIALQAEGTNSRSQQRVQLSGNFVVTNLAGAPPLGDPQALLTNEAAMQFLFSNARIEGQVTVGNSNLFPLLAFPAGR